MTNRTHCRRFIKQWIVNSTTIARVAHLGLERSVPVGYWWTIDQSFPEDGPANDKNRYFLPKDLAIAEAFCFASPNATDAATGASGVVCSSEDFRALFVGRCGQIHYKVRFMYLLFFIFTLSLYSRHVTGRVGSGGGGKRREERKKDCAAPSTRLLSESLLFRLLIKKSI